MEIKIFKPADHKIKALIYGASGSGKTTFASTAPKPIFASAENGLLSIADKEVPYVEIKTIKDLSDLLTHLKTQPHDFKTVVIDSITEINDVIKEEIEKKKGGQMTLPDWGVLSKKINKIIRAFRDLPMHVIFIAQENNIVDEDKISKIVPSLNGKAATKIAYIMDIVGYLHIDKATKKRVIIVNSHEKLLTKDRSNVVVKNPELDFSKWCEEVSKISIGDEKVVTSYDSDVDPLDDKKVKPKKKSAPTKKKENPPVNNVESKDLPEARPVFTKERLAGLADKIKENLKSGQTHQEMIVKIKAQFVLPEEIESDILKIQTLGQEAKNELPDKDWDTTAKKKAPYNYKDTPEKVENYEKEKTEEEKEDQKDFLEKVSENRKEDKEKKVEDIFQKYSKKISRVKTINGLRKIQKEIVIYIELNKINLKDPRVIKTQKDYLEKYDAFKSKEESEGKIDSEGVSKIIEEISKIETYAQLEIFQKKFKEENFKEKMSKEDFESVRDVFIEKGTKINSANNN